MDIDEIASRLEIEHALTLYCLGVDAGDAEAIKRSFHPDATDEHGPWQGLGWELAARLQHSAEHPEGRGHHEVCNVFIEFDSPDVARVSSYVHAYHPVKDDEDKDRLLIFAGRYLDRFERRDGDWKIAARKVMSDFHSLTDLDPPMPGFPVGRKGRGVDDFYRMFPV
jgi:SnoaL-like domain